MIKKFLSVGLTIVLFSLSSCAGFKAHNLPEIEDKDLKFSSENKVKVYSKWELDSKAAVMNDQIKSSRITFYKQKFENAIKKADCCILVEWKDEADIIVEGVAYEEDHSLAMLGAMISGATFTILPTWITTKADISVNAKKYNKSYPYKLSDSATMVIWLPLIIVTPFQGNIVKIENDVYENTFKTLVVKMGRDGLFKSSPLYRKENEIDLH